MTSTILALTAFLFSMINAHAQTSEELGREMAALVRGQPRATTKSLNELIDEVNVCGFNKVAPFDEFLKGFLGPGVNHSEMELRLSALAAQLDLGHPGNRAFNLAFAAKAQSGYSMLRFYLAHLAARLAGKRSFSSYGLLPLLDSILADTRFGRARDQAISSEIGDARDRLIGYLARQAKGDARTVLAADELRGKIADCAQPLVAEMVARDYP